MLTRGGVPIELTKLNGSQGLVIVGQFVRVAFLAELSHGKSPLEGGFHVGEVAKQLGEIKGDSIVVKGHKSFDAFN